MERDKKRRVLTAFAIAAPALLETKVEGGSKEGK